MLQLRYKNSEKKPLWLVDAKYTLGSDSSCDIHIDDATVSSQQAEISVSQEGVSLTNLGAAEALAVNGEFATEPHTLKHGDTLSIGSTALEVVDPKLLRDKAGSPAESPSTQAASGWVLKAMNTALANKHFPIDRDVVIGRSNECDITLGVAHLSRRHAKLSVSGTQLEVEDLRSSNGTYVNGKQVQRSLLRDGDELSFDTLTFSVMGACDDSDSTMLRPQQDIHKTTVRPAIKTSDVVKTPKPRPSGSPKPAARKSASSTQTPSTAASESKGSSGGSANIILAVVVVAIVAVAAWFLL